jgi:hypothetical protein
MTINSTSWKKMPIAPRNTSYAFQDAVARIADWASGSVDRFASAFLWRDPNGPANNKNSYRLPIADVYNGRLTLVPHAVFSAAAILSGAHGELEGVVDEQEKLKLKGVITDIYAQLQADYGDPRVKPPWLRGGNEEEQVTAAMDNINASGWDTMPVAVDDEVDWSVQKAQKALWEHADGDIREYRKGFLWWDRGAPEQKNSYRLPIATVANGGLVLVPRAVTAMAQILASARGVVDIPDDDMDAVESTVKVIKNILDGNDSITQLQHDAGDVVTASALAPVKPPLSWFEDPRLDGPTPIAVTADGRVMGHLAAWGTCHAGIGNQCVMAPKTATGYRYFRNGSVITADGSTVRVGKITAGTGHADTRLGWVPASDHYDNTGKQVAIVASGEDRWGIWVAGALVPEADDNDAAMLRRSPLSGDWRRINGNLELVAALAVNTPGFPIVSLNASGEPDALCAAGVVAEDGTIIGLDSEALTESERTLLNRLKEQQSYVAAATRSRLLRRYNNLVSQGRGSDMGGGE